MKKSKVAIICLIVLSLLSVSCQQEILMVQPQQNISLTQIKFNSTTEGQPIIFDSKSTFFNDIQSPIFVTPGVVNSSTFDETVQAYIFHKDILAQQDYVYLSIQLPHGYKEGSDLYCHIHWEPTTTNTGSVNFSIKYDWYNFGVIDNNFLTTSAKQNASGVAYASQIMNFPPLNGTGKTISSILKIKLMRESASTSDTYTGDNLVDFFDCHYESDTLGSASEYGKWS